MKSQGHRTVGRTSSAGFTLVEMIMAVSISVMVFAAMGVLLTRCFSLWIDASAHWRMAKYARISRERMLSGGFADPSSGLLSATNISIVKSSSALNFGYATYSGYFGICGFTNIIQPRLYLLKQNTLEPYWIGGYTDWRWGVRADKALPIPVMELIEMQASLSNDLAILEYRLRFSAGGRTFEQPHTIRARLINME